MKHLRHIGPAILLLSGILQGAFETIARAANYPTGNLTFAGGEVRFPTGSINFPSHALSFPTGLMRTESPTTIEVTLPADILFDFDKSDIRNDAQGALRELAQLLRDKARGPVTIQGYTDALGSDAYNQKLSERRAAAVKTWLGTWEGLSAMPFTVAGFGARNPVAPNRHPDGSDNPEGRQLNRRVTLIIRK
jgi:outer membrane protein OmpA-like peptidoglycan-associated protein